MEWFIAHLVGDYLLQNDWMAQNKKGALLPPPVPRIDGSSALFKFEESEGKWLRGTGACLLHVALYTLSVAAFTGWPWWALLIVAVTHFIQDRTQVIAWWMKVNRQEGFAKPPLAPWSVIVVDNVWHLLTLYLISLFV